MHSYKKISSCLKIERFMNEAVSINRSTSH